MRVEPGAGKLAFNVFEQRSGREPRTASRHDGAELLLPNCRWRCESVALRRLRKFRRKLREERLDPRKPSIGDRRRHSLAGFYPRRTRNCRWSSERVNKRLIDEPVTRVGECRPIAGERLPKSMGI